MSYREKAAWIGFVTFLVAWGFYFVMLARTLASGGSQSDVFPYSVIGSAISVLLVAWIQRRHSKREQEQADEREQILQLRSSEIAFRALMVMVGMAMLAALATNNALTGVALAEPGYSVFHALLLLVVLTGLVRFAAEIILFRRGGV